MSYLLIWIVHIFAALFIAGALQYFLVGGGFVSVHNGAPGFLVFAGTLVVLRLSERSPSSNSEPPQPPAPHEPK